ncbi:MAG: DUF4105 domain-containing protein, partial [Proteobacteria bacterium]|nr:DUF4105 domain-containing protein [Pseudomonadota bacterium]
MFGVYKGGDCEFYGKIILRSLLIVGLTVGFWLPAPASDYAVLWRQAEEKQLARHAYWLRLLHYRSPLESLGQWSEESDVRSPTFFLSPQGRSNPEKELKATLKALWLPAGENGNAHAQCRFIARYHWLKSELDFSGVSLPEVDCSLFRQWIEVDKVESVSLIYVSAFMGNPASVYGHILLKINLNENSRSSHFLLSPTFNFGATVSPSDNPAAYAFKGLFGGYGGRFTDERFYNFSHLYGENELRDMWEYRLNLDDKQIRRIVHHAWELFQGSDFDYYFLLDNCAYRMAELLEAAWDQKRINPGFGLYSIPIDVFHKINRMENNGRPLIRKIRLYPSRQRQLRRKVGYLSGEQFDLMKTVVENFDRIDSPKYRSLDERDKAQLIDALIDYYKFRQVDDRKTDRKETIEKLLTIRSKLPILGESPPTPVLKPPTDGTPPGLVRLGIEQTSNGEVALQLGIRPSYYDLLDSETGKLPNTQIIALDLNLGISPDKATIRRLKLFDIVSLNLSPTRLGGDSGWSWRARAELEPQNLECEDCLVFHLSSGLGKALSIADTDVWFAFTDLYFRTGSTDTPSSTFGLQPTVGMMFSPTSSWKFLIDGNYFQSLSDPESSFSTLGWENRFSISSTMDIRFKVLHQQGSELSLTVN